MGKLRAGTAIMDISPEAGVELAGYPHYPRHNTGIHDPLFAGCICLDDGRTKLAIVTMDLLFFSKKHVRQVRERLDKSGIIPGNHVMFCCSHTHSGPWAAGRLDLEALEKGLGQDGNYITRLLDIVYDLVIQSCTDQFAASVGIGVGKCGKEQGVGGNRRSPDGPSDPSVNVLGVKDASGAWRACLVCYTLHPTLLHGESTLVSADYPGYVRESLMKTFPGINVLFAQGTSGNQSSRYFRTGQTFGEARRIGIAIGDEAGRVLSDLQMRNDLELAMQSTEMQPELRKYPSRCEAERNVEATKAETERLNVENAPYIERRNAELRLLGAEDILGYIQLNERGIRPDLLADELPLELQALRIGDECILGFQGEAFVEFGLEIKRRSKFDKTLVLELANGAAPGYIYTRESLEDGGYETDTSMLGASCGEMLVDEAERLLELI